SSDDGGWTETLADFGDSRAIFPTTASETWAFLELEHPMTIDSSRPAVKAASPGIEEPENLAPELSILVPCLDEQDNVTITLGQVGEVMREAGLDDFEILVLDDASSDATFERSVEYSHLHPDLHIRTHRRHAPRRGYGAIVRHGVAHAHGTWVVPVSGDGVDA